MTKALETLREEARDLGREDVLVGWFTKAVDVIGSAFFAPVRDVFVATLSWDHDRVFSRFNPPVTLSILPLIWHTKKVHIGGNGWRRLGQRQYLRFLSPSESDWDVQLSTGRVDTPQPVGWMYLLYDKSGSPYSIGRKKDAITSRAVEMALHMLRWHKDRPERKGDRQVSMPALVHAKAPRTYLKLRDSKEIDQKALSNAQSGIWDFVTSDGSNELHALTRGNAVFDSETNEVFIDDKAGGQSVDKECSEQFLEKEIMTNFGKCVKISLQPAIDSMDGYVQAGQSLFRPVEKRDWTLQELKAREDWPTLAHLAAFTEAYRHAGHVIFDADMVEAEQEPWVDGNRTTICTSVVNRPPALRDSSSAGEMDLFNTPLRKAAPATLRRVFRIG